MVKEERDKTITENIGLVHSIAKRFKGRNAEYDDLFQAGCVGLIKAVDNFDESRGFQFSTYAVPVIMGEIKRLFRDGGAIKISRSLKEKSNRLQSVREEFINKENREPAISELSALTGFSTEELVDILNASNPVSSLSSDEGEEFDIPFDESDKLINKIAVDLAKKKLSKMEQNLINLRFFQGKTQCETAKALNISQVQVSRKEKAALQKMRSELE